ncbi:NADP-specific glutamate dehydrogenase [Marinibactrum halimedae]|uniref:Glutamate dehydrogenase n=1 Tax=Marinibactrum halimedae TaxID=1444977 RepID=A0AA37T5K4_9GAMM|nr:NADP-specific glutamate dehydrogenase [Marinibactrum halimedae]MCD9460861.1 NADP-specific glutamate dehydrogenase [Marinibactrum halimedae]GLS27360.1 glutamate dehydrogenase [Marinibactrum halimedae]
MGYYQLDRFVQEIKQKNPYEPEFYQAVSEFSASVIPFINAHSKYQDVSILERLTEPDRIISFRVTWRDDNKVIQTNRGWRVQFSNAIGPYKGGLRFHPTVNQSVLKFLGFEQIFKNSLTGLPMGGAKGGSNFNPRGKSDDEIMAFCYYFMLELHRHIGEDVDIPAGDIGVGSREIDLLFGAYKKLANKWTGTLTGKGLEFGGSLLRKEATGYGCVYFCHNMLNVMDESLEGKICVVSGSGNVAIYAAEQLLVKGAKVVTMSDSSGFIYDKEGINQEKLEYIKQLKEVDRKRIREYCCKYDKAEYIEGAKPWSVPCDAAFPCATQNEIDLEAAKTLASNGVKVVCEGANMPCSNEAIEFFKKQGIIFAPGKASNAGGVSVSGIEQSQNALHMSWEKNRINQELERIMLSIHEKCREYGESNGDIDYVKGANIAGFVRVADTMIKYGVM